MHHHLSAIILEHKKTTRTGLLLYFGLVFFKSVSFLICFFWCLKINFVLLNQFA